MHILIISEAFIPETKSAATLFFELGESLVKKGHKVSVVTRMPRYNVAEGAECENLPPSEKISGMTVYRFNIPPLTRTVPFIRGFEHFIIALVLLRGGLMVQNYDLILVYSPPLTLGITGYFLSKIRKKPLIVNIQDLYPQTVIDLGLLKNKLLIGISKAMESFNYKNSTVITVHSEGNRDYVISKGAGPETTKVVHNWVDTDMIKPGDKDNAFSQKYDLSKKFVVSFGGVIGFAQGLEVLIEAAHKLQEFSDIQIVIVGDGVKRESLIKRALDLELNNITFVKTQSRDLYPLVLHSSDVCIVTLRPELQTPVVPSKILSIMAAGRPVVASLHLSGDAPKILERFNCGISVEPNRPDLLANAIVKLYNNRKLCEEMGQRGREAAEKFFSRQNCIDQYESIFNSCKTTI